MGVERAAMPCYALLCQGQSSSKSKWQRNIVQRYARVKVEELDDVSKFCRPGGVRKEWTVATSSPLYKIDNSSQKINMKTTKSEEKNSPFKN